jgi:hypothetical protein
MIGTSRAPGTRARLVALAPALAGALAACNLDFGGATVGNLGGGDPTPQCSDCVGEDGGVPAPPGIDGRRVALLDTQAPDPAITSFVLRGTFPVPPHSFPRADGRLPFAILDYDGTVLPTQTEIVSRYANEAQGADVVEVLAKVRRDPAVAQFDTLSFAVVQQPSLAPNAPGPHDLGDLQATASLPASIQAILSNASALEIRTYDCFGNRYVCRPFDGTGSHELMRHGRVSSELRIFQTLRPEPFVGGASGTLPHSFGVHVYLSTYTGQEILGLGLRFTNGHSGRDTTTDQDNPLDKLYFSKIELVVPSTMHLRQDLDDPFLGEGTVVGADKVLELVEPLPGGKLHVIRWLGQFHRRLWLFGPSGGNSVGAYANGMGQAFCARGRDPVYGHEYWSWWNKGTSRYFPQKYQLPKLDHVGRQTLRNQLANTKNHLTTRLRDGSSDGDYPIASGVLGWGHPYGVSYGGMTSGEEIFCWDGVRTAAAASVDGLQMYRALHRMHSNRQPNVLYDVDGEPTSVERWLRGSGAGAYVPFYHYIVPFLGGSYPDPFGFAAAPRFQINHVASAGLKPGYEGAHLSFDPHDWQHLIRYTRSAKVLAWLGNDSIAKDDLRMQAEMFHLSYHRYQNDQYGGIHSSGLRSHKAVVQAHPQKGGPFGRGEAWGLDCAVAAYSLADPEWRANKRPWLADILQMLLLSQGSCNGFLQAQVSSKAVEGRYRARQQIEQSITENALQGLRESVFRGADAALSDMARDVLVDSLYGFISDMAWSSGNGPWRYTGVGPKDVSLPIWCSGSQMPGDAITPNDYETYQDWSSFAYAYEITGDPIFLERAHVQFGSVGTLMNRLLNEGTNNIQNRSALIALMQHLDGQI